MKTETTDNSPLLSLENVEKTYRNGKGVHKLNLTLERGDFYGLLGPNGAGKSTTLYMSLGLIHRDGGSLKLCGEDPERNPVDSRKKVGFLLEQPRFHPQLSVLKNIRVLNLHRCKVTKEESRELLNTVGLEEEPNVRVKHFSTGMKQRLGIACALAGKPDLLLLDEPTTNLDPEGRDRMIRLFTELNNEQQVTFLYCTHRIEDAEALCNRVGILKEGELKKDFPWPHHMEIQEPHLLVEVEDPEMAKQVFKDEQIDWTYVRKDRRLFRLSRSPKSAADLNKTLVSAGVSVRRIARERNELLEIYRSV